MRYVILVIFCVFLAACAAKAGVFSNMLQTKPYPKVFFTGDLLKVAKAIKANEIDKAKALAEKLPNIDARGAENFTLLAFAVADNNIPAISMLMALGANPEIEIGGGEHMDKQSLGYFSMSPIVQKNADGLKALLEGGMNPDIPYESGTLLHAVFGFKYNDALKHLVEHGANVNARNGIGETPLHNLVLTGFDEALYLLENGADPFVMENLGLTVAYSVQDSLESMDKSSEAYQKMLRIQQKMIELGVQFPALSPYGERARLDIVWCHSPSGYRTRSECEIIGDMPRFIPQSEESKRQDEKILRERYGMDIKL